MKHILKCQKCGAYTMKEKCACEGQAVTTKPQRYAPDKYGKYRREAKREDLTKRGLL